MIIGLIQQLYNQFLFNKSLDTGSFFYTVNSSIVLQAKNIGSSWDIKNLCPNYKDLTADNFYIGCSGQNITLAGFCWVNFNWIKSYNSNTGIFSVSLSTSTERDETWYYSTTIQPILLF